MVCAIKSLPRRVATALAVVAALAFALDGALGADHHRAPAPAGSHHHAHDHGHHDHGHHDHGHQGHGGGAGHHHDSHHGDHDVASLAAAGGDAVLAQHGADAQPGADACWCCCASCSAVTLPVLGCAAMAATPLPALALLDGRHRDGIVPDGLRRPPRPIAIT